MGNLCKFSFFLVYLLSSIFLAILSSGFYTQHIWSMLVSEIIHLLILFQNDFDYGWNMKVCIVCSVCTSLLYIYHLIIRYQRFSRLSQSDYTLIKMLLLTNCSVLLEVLDFIPIFWTFDSHSFFHLATVPLPFMFSQFLIDLDKEYTVFLTAKNV